MLRVEGWLWVHVGLLWWMLGSARVGGIIEIVEEQQCHDAEFRLTCRELQTHIAVLEAWYTSIENYHQNYTVTNKSVTMNRSLAFESDSELNKVYVYSSPKHNGFYEAMNHSNFENVTHWPVLSNDSSVNESVSEFVNETFVDLMEDVNSSAGCAGLSFLKSSVSWRGEVGRRRVIPETSVNLRAPVTYRCTGVNHCSFILQEDFPASKVWMPGVVYIKYACFDDNLSSHYCNGEVRIGSSGPTSEGYLRSPGYPNYYSGGDCNWRLTVAGEQRVQLTLLDVSFRSIAEPYETACTDYAVITSSDGEELMSTCEQVELPLRVVSPTSSVNVTVVVRSKGAFPKRGILIHYKSVGCVTLPAPSNGYLVYRNKDVAHYMCNVNRVFADSRERSRLIWCYKDNRWNDSVPLCIAEPCCSSIETLRNEFNWSDIRQAAKAEEAAGDAFRNDSASIRGGATKLPHSEPNMIVDIVIPSLLIAALFIGNAFIVLIIYKYRKRKTDDLEDEFNTIPLSVNGNAGNAV